MQIRFVIEQDQYYKLINEEFTVLDKDSTVTLNPSAGYSIRLNIAGKDYVGNELSVNYKESSQDNIVIYFSNLIED